jgi:hypothetical protein
MAQLSQQEITQQEIDELEHERNHLAIETRMVIEENNRLKFQIVDLTGNYSEDKVLDKKVYKVKLNELGNYVEKLEKSQLHDHEQRNAMMRKRLVLEKWCLDQTNEYVDNLVKK